MPRDPEQVQKAEENGLGARFQAGADPGVGASTLSPDRVVPIWQSGVQHCQALGTGQKGGSFLLFYF